MLQGMAFRQLAPEQAYPDLKPREACDQAIESVRDKANANSRLARMGTAVITLSSASIPVLIIASTQWEGFVLGKLLPAAMASVSGAMAGWMQFSRPHERWKLYRGYQRALEIERLKYDNDVEPYDDGEWRDRVFVERIAELQLALHDEWGGLVPRSSDLLKRSDIEQPSRQPPA
jgi:hypothetical protein